MTINKNMLPIEDIIPITFVGGSGGNFLCHFIVSAKVNFNQVIALSLYGNAHKDSMKDIASLPVGLDVPDQEKIDYVFSQLEDNHQEYPVMNHTLVKPYYTTLHIQDIDTINNNFKKSIRITYDLDDINELVAVYHGKWFIDEVNRNTAIKISDSAHLYFTKKSLTKMNKFFCKIENMPSVLFISWKELFSGNIDELVTKLSTFTHINTTNFSSEALTQWRDKTQYCIDTFTEQPN
jgi:hypothetical protein